MDRAKAVDLLKGLIASGSKLNPLDDKQRERWQLDCRATLERVFGKDSRQLQQYSDVHWTPRVISQDQNKNRERKEEAKQSGLQRSMTILESSLSEVEQFWELDQGSVSVDPFRLIERLCNRFHGVARQLRKRHGNRPTLDVEDEFDVQDLIHAVLLLDFDDVRPEEWTGSYAGASSRIDFILKNERIGLLKNERIGLEVKRAQRAHGKGDRRGADCRLPTV